MIIELEEEVEGLELTEEAIIVIETYDFDLPSGITNDSFTQKGTILVGLGAGLFAELPPGDSGQYLTPDDNEVLGLKWAVPNISVTDSTNFLINGGFDFAQRQAPGSATTIADQKYGPDRWKCERANADFQYTRVSAVGETGLNSQYYGKFAKITNTNKWMVYQIIPHHLTVPLRGKTVTFQFKVKTMTPGTNYTFNYGIFELQAAGTADSIPSPIVTAWNAQGVTPTFGTNIAAIALQGSTAAPDTWTNVSISATIPADSKNIIVGILTRSTTNLTAIGIAEAGLYISSSTLSWNPRPLQQERRLIEEYYQKSYPIDTAPGTASINGMITVSAYSTSAALFLDKLIRMRGTPVMAGYSYNGTANKLSTNALADIGGTVTIGNITDTGPRTATDSGTAFTAGAVYLTHFTADAEL